MVPMKRLTLEEHCGKDSKYDEGNGLLDDLELHQRKRTSILVEADAVCRHLTTVLKKGQAPA